MGEKLLGHETFCRIEDHLQELDLIHKCVQALK